MAEDKKDQLDQIKTILMQPSTWKGLVLILAAFGIQSSPEELVTISQTAAAIYGVIAILVDKG